VTIPVAVVVSFVLFRLLGLTANIMSLGGLVIAVGALVDAAIVVVEQTHKKLEQAQRDGSRRDARDVVVEAVKEVAPASFFALLVIAVSFLPLLTLQAEEGRLFRPLVYTKTLAMVVAAVLAVTLDPALRVMLTRTAPLAFRPRWVRDRRNRAHRSRRRVEDNRRPVAARHDEAMLDDDRGDGNHAVTAHRAVSAVVKKEHAGVSARRRRLGEHGTAHVRVPARLEDECTPQMIGMTARPLAFVDHRLAARRRKTVDDETEWPAGSVRVDCADLHRLDGRDRLDGQEGRTTICVLPSCQSRRSCVSRPTELGL